MKTIIYATIGLFLLLTGIGWLSFHPQFAFNHFANNNPTNLSIGTITPHGENAPIFKGVSLQPGQSTTSWVTVVNKSDVAIFINVQAILTRSIDQQAASHISLLIEDSAGRTIYSSSLSRLQFAIPGSAGDKWQPGEEHRYTIKLIPAAASSSLPEGFSFDVSWTGSIA